MPRGRGLYFASAITRWSRFRAGKAGAELLVQDVGGGRNLKRLRGILATACGCGRSGLIPCAGGWNSRLPTSCNKETELAAQRRRESAARSGILGCARHLNREGNIHRGYDYSFGTRNKARL